MTRRTGSRMTLHAPLEEALPYPAARDVIAEEALIDDEVEHDSVHALIDQLRGMDADDEKYTARFTVLCEYVLRPVKEEGGGMFPQLGGARLGWESLAAEMPEHREARVPRRSIGTGA